MLAEVGQIETSVYILDMLGVVACAISGVLVASRLRMDPFGMLVLAGVTAIGGGTLRDMLMGATPVFWIRDNNYIYVILTTAILMVLWLHNNGTMRRFSTYLLPLVDALGLAVFTIIGTEKALSLGFSPVIAIVMGCVTGVGGGMIRDVLGGQIPFVLQKEIYATASILGAVVYVICDAIGENLIFSMLLAMAATLTLRISAIYRQLKLPVFQKGEP
jgi:uncharacterized membrane protein YeiH